MTPSAADLFGTTDLSAVTAEDFLAALDIHFYADERNGRIYVYDNRLRIPPDTTHLPNLSRLTLNGCFDCSGSAITSLAGSPSRVHSLDCSNCDRLESTAHGPVMIAGEVRMPRHLYGIDEDFGL